MESVVSHKAEIFLVRRFSIALCKVLGWTIELLNTERDVSIPFRNCDGFLRLSVVFCTKQAVSMCDSVGTDQRGRTFIP
jgi:hypothetical protein